MGDYCGIATGHEITGEEDAILSACRVFALHNAEIS